MCDQPQGRYQVWLGSHGHSHSQSGAHANQKSAASSVNRSVKRGVISRKLCK